MCSTYILTLFLVLWHVEPLLGNDREISNYTTAVDNGSENDSSY
jgi:hypothetical protein